MRFMLALILMLKTHPLLAGELELAGNFIQGGLIHGQTEPGATVTMNGKPLAVLKDGRFIIGLGRDQKPRLQILAVMPDGRKWSKTVRIKQRKYDVQRIDGLPRKKVTPDPAAVKRILADNAKIKKARQKARVSNGFESGFIWPVKARLSGVFGSQRILNGIPKRPHNGVDIAGPENATILAAADGVVAVADGGMFLSGKTIILDHGLGLTSAYIHMSKILVKPGQRVKKGTPIGAIGHTGRVTGPHLHWGVHWFQQPLDPALLAGP